MTSTSSYELELLRQLLEEEYGRHTARLTTLASGDPDSESTGSDQHTRDALIASSRRALSDIAHALRRMAQGTYGRCERCQIAVPAERLEVLPHTRYCASCQAAGR